MKNLILFVIIFVFWFVIGTGVGFKILEWISSQTLVDAWDTTAKQFEAQYSGSATQQKLNQMFFAKLEQQRQAFITQTETSLKAYAIQKISNIFK